jgi:Raf kinase inhibitor-like YbhB/YbcL family protein
MAKETTGFVQIAMRVARLSLLLAIAIIPIVLSAQPPPPAAPPGGQQPGQPPPGGRGGRGGGRGAIQVMTLTSPAWQDGGTIPVKYTQAGEDVSPPLAWSNVPPNVTSFVLIVHDADAATGNGLDDITHWMLWNVPATTTSLPEHVPSMSQMPDGTRQNGATAPHYRGPGAAAAGPAHHYIFELYALDSTVDVPAVGQTPAQTRAAVVAAMTGHVRGKAVYVGLFRRQS